MALLNDGGVVQFFFVFVKSERRMNGKNAAGREKKRERRVGVEKKKLVGTAGQRPKNHKAFGRKKSKVLLLCFSSSLLPPSLLIAMGGGPISRHGALSTACGRFVLAPAGAALRIYSCSTSNSNSTAAASMNRDASSSSTAAGTLVGELLGHDADVTAVSRNPENDEQVRGLRGGERETGEREERERWHLTAAVRRHFFNAPHPFLLSLAIPNPTLS